MSYNLEHNQTNILYNAKISSFHKTVQDFTMTQLLKINVYILNHHHDSHFYLILSISNKSVDVSNRTIYYLYLRIEY